MSVQAAIQQAAYDAWPDQNVFLGPNDRYVRMMLNVFGCAIFGSFSRELLFRHLAGEGFGSYENIGDFDFLATRTAFISMKNVGLGVFADCHNPQYDELILEGYQIHKLTRGCNEMDSHVVVPSRTDLIKLALPDLIREFAKTIDFDVNACFLTMHYDIPLWFTPHGVNVSIKDGTACGVNPVNPQRINKMLERGWRLQLSPRK